MHRSGRNLAGKNAAAEVCSCEIMSAICFIGELLEPELGTHGDMQDGFQHGREGAEHGRSRGEHSGKKRATGKKGGWEYFYAQENSICQLLGDRELGWGIIGEWFFAFL